MPIYCGMKVEQWLRPTPQGLYCVPGDFYIDPTRSAERAVITHGHGDHARPGNKRVLATAETLAIMKTRFGAQPGSNPHALAYGERIDLGGVGVRLAPAGHILGSAQVVLEHAGSRVVVSGDFKRRPDPTCEPFEPVPCDLFITEATFGLPVFRHPDDRDEIAKLLESLRLFPERAHVLGVYSLGKAQRVLALIRRAGWDRPVWIHGALASLIELYQRLGQDFGEVRPVKDAGQLDLAGQVVLAPPSAIGDVWSRRLPDPLAASASGWMGVRARARQGGIELPLVISDHADWDELTRTITELGAPDLWVTHGAEEALVHFAGLNGIRARALSLVGYEDEEQ